MSEYTPTTEQVRYGYRFWREGGGLFDSSAEFDAWLNEVKAEAWDEGWVCGLEDAWRYASHKNPYRKTER